LGIRTDNAVKNRFSTLCKKRAKDEALHKENNVPYANTDMDKYKFTRDRLISAGVDVSSLPAKKMRYKFRGWGCGLIYCKGFIKLVEFYHSVLLAQ
jgi:hypothetical protein